TVTDGNPLAPAVGKLVTFTVVAGPNLGVTGTGTTDAAGQASFTYTGSAGAGTDKLPATFVGGQGNTQHSHRGGRRLAGLARNPWVQMERPGWKRRMGQWRAGIGRLDHRAAAAGASDRYHHQRRRSLHAADRSRRLQVCRVGRWFLSSAGSAKE